MASQESVQARAMRRPVVPDLCNLDSGVLVCPYILYSTQSARASASITSISVTASRPTTRVRLGSTVAELRVACKLPKTTSALNEAPGAKCTASSTHTAHALHTAPCRMQPSRSLVALVVVATTASMTLAAVVGSPGGSTGVSSMS
ncbi:hypothetical protein HaLaN_29121 [Haematococcus lacustris]|uniref:Uncharacterized protein n=1 Tax=Haematococcus lacustris TaxID=44745 RepID=A0A6A0AC40_HAELA|nr:hypothetical protein HaLaN_29121 [Haematococcus lacustris]